MRISSVIVLVISLTFLRNVGFGQAHDEATATIGVLESIKSASVYPNPATDFLTIKFELPVAKRLKVTLHNIIGNTIETETEILDDFEIKIKTKDLPVGYYLIALRDGDTPAKGSFKFLKR